MASLFTGQCSHWRPEKSVFRCSRSVLCLIATAALGPNCVLCFFCRLFSLSATMATRAFQLNRFWRVLSPSVLHMWISEELAHSSSSAQACCERWAQILWPAALLRFPIICRPLCSVCLCTLSGRTSCCSRPGDLVSEPHGLDRESTADRRELPWAFVTSLVRDNLW